MRLPINRIKLASLICGLIILIFLSSCRKVEKEYYPDGRIKTEKNLRGKELDGPFRLWYQSGVMQQETQYKRGKPEGRMIRWYANGNKESEDNYMAGRREGKSLTFDETGNLVEEKNYSNDTLNGPYRLLYPTGVPRIEGKYYMGMFDGKWQYFTETGFKVGEGNFDKGTGILKGFDSMGHLNHEVHYVKNKKSGNEIEYNADGSVKETKVFDQDKVIKVLKGE